MIGNDSIESTIRMEHRKGQIMKRIFLCGVAMIGAMSVAQLSAAGYGPSGNGSGCFDTARYNNNGQASYRVSPVSRYGSNDRWYANSNNSWPPANGNTGFTGIAPNGTCVNGKCGTYCPTTKPHSHQFQGVSRPNTASRYWNSVDNYQTYNRNWNNNSNWNNSNWNNNSWNIPQLNYRPYSY